LDQRNFEDGGVFLEQFPIHFLLVQIGLSNLHQIVHLTDLNLFVGIEQLLVIMIIARNLSS